MTLMCKRVEELDDLARILETWIEERRRGEHVMYGLLTAIFLFEILQFALWALHVAGVV